MPYIELRNYSREDNYLSLEQRDEVVELVRNHLARSKQVDGTFEFHYIENGSKLDRCEYSFILVIDMGWSEDREANKTKLAQKIGIDLAQILGTDSLAIRLRLQNAAFVPFKK